MRMIPAHVSGSSEVPGTEVASFAASVCNPGPAKCEHVIAPHFQGSATVYSPPAF